VSDGANPRAPITTAIVLAAGKSTRIQRVAAGRPKPLIEVGGQTVLARNLRQLAAAGVTTAWINLHFAADQIRAAIGDGQACGLRVEYSYEPEILGTAGAIAKIGPSLAPEPFFVMYGDNVVRLDLAAMTERHRASGACATVAVFDRDHTANTGLAGGRVLLDAAGNITEFREGSGSGTSPYVNAGVYLLDPSVLSVIPIDRASDFGHDIFPELLAQGRRLAAYAIDGYCLAIDTPEALAQAELLLKDLQMPQAGVRS
jgi:mannose-1-phosphate guanylyltransferase